MGRFNFKPIGDEKIVKGIKDGGSSSVLNNHTASVTPLTTEKTDLIGMINENFTNLTIKANQSDLNTTNTNVASNASVIATHTSQIASLSSGSPKGVYTYFSDLQSAFPSGNSNIYIVLGNKVEVDTLTITAIPTASANITITLNGIGTTVAVTTSMTTTDAVATAIRGTTFSGWTTGGTGSIITFTKSAVGTCSTPTFNAGTTGSNGTFVVTTKGADADGKWYYWNGSAWTAGGTYQSTGIAEKTLDYNNFTDNLKLLLNNDFTNLTPSFTSGQYISSSGNIGTSAGFQYSAPIQLKQNESIVFYASGYNTSVAMICTCDSSGNNRVVQKVCANSNYAIFSYTATQDTYVIVSCQNYSLLGKVYNYQSLINSLKFKNTYVNLTPNYTTGQYIAGSGNIYTSSGFQYSDLITLNFGDTLTVTVTGYSTSVSIISEWDSTGTIFLNALVKSVDSTNRNYTFTASKDATYVKISGLSSPAIIVQKYNISNEISSATNTRITNLESYANVNFGNLCRNVLCAGDSLTEGFNGTVLIPWSYPSYIAKLANWSVTNAGKSGITAENWWKTKATTYDYTTFDTVIICLGTNEGLTDTLSADTATGDYTTYADTGTGDYCKIIEYIKAQNSNIKIFLCTIFASHTDYLATTNSVIKKIATKYNLPVIDTNISPFSCDHAQNSLIHPIDNVHMGKVGYLEFAQYIYSQMVNYISKNLSSFNS